MRIAHRVEHRDRSAGERAISKGQLEPLLGDAAPTEFIDVRAAGGRRHGVRDQCDPVLPFRLEGDASRRLMNMKTIRDKTAQDARIRERGPDQTWRAMT